MADVSNHLADLRKEILEKSKEVAKKLDLLEILSDHQLEKSNKKALKLTFEYEGNKPKSKYCRLKIYHISGINGTIYVPKEMNIISEKILLEIKK